MKLIQKYLVATQYTSRIQLFYRAANQLAQKYESSLLTHDLSLLLVRELDELCVRSFSQREYYSSKSVRENIENVRVQVFNMANYPTDYTSFTDIYNQRMFRE